jgi:hypothetical protein
LQNILNRKVSGESGNYGTLLIHDDFAVFNGEGDDTRGHEKGLGPDRFQRPPDVDESDFESLECNRVSWRQLRCTASKEIFNRDSIRL